MPLTRVTRRVRTWLGLVLLGLVIVASPAHGRSREPSLDDLRAAFQFAFPVYEMARTRAEAAERAKADGRPFGNSLLKRQALTDPATQRVTAPNNDTLYASAWLDLAAGPVMLEVPAGIDRYHSFALMNLFTDNVAIRGTRVDGARGGRFLIAGPRWRGRAPRGMVVLRSNTDDAWLLGRTVVHGAADLAASRRDAEAYRLTGGAVRPVAAVATTSRDPENFITVVNEMLGRSELSPRDRSSLKRFAPVGIAPGDISAWQRLPSATREAWRRNIAKFNDELVGGYERMGETRDGWFYPRAGIGEAGADDEYRARVALSGLAALPRVEAVYLSAEQDGSGQTLSGKHTYTLTLPARVPVNAFWSLTMYEIMADGRYFLIENPLSRYAIGDRTAGLNRNRDGSLTLNISRVVPSDTANWLPSPEGRFRLSFRMYLPQQQVLDGDFRLPEVRRSESKGC